MIEALVKRLRGAAFWEPYLDLILTGQKTVESRFSRRRIAPYGCVAAGDVLRDRPTRHVLCGVQPKVLCAVSA